MTKQLWSFLLTLTVIIVPVLLLADDAKKDSKLVLLGSDTNTVSFIYGMSINIHDGFGNDNVELNIDKMVEGFTSSVEGNKLKVSTKEAMAEYYELQKDPKDKKESTATPAVKKKGIDKNGEASYLYGEEMGVHVGGDLTEGKIELNTKAFLAGFKHAANGKKSPFSRKDSQAAFAKIIMHAINPLGKKGDAGKQYLAKNAIKKGVIVTKSGLQYEIIKAGKGEGKTPVEQSIVTTHYTGRLINRTVFDSSVERGKPISFPLSRVIEGWTEVLQLMHVGDKWKVTIPPELGYKKRAMRDIPANSVLVFEIELLKFR